MLRHFEPATNHLSCGPKFRQLYSTHTMANIQTTTSVLRVRSSSTMEDTALWRVKRIREPRLITMPSTPVSTPSPPDRGACATSTPSQGRKETSARSGRPRYNPTGPDYKPVGPEPMIVPTGERDITKSWRRDNSPNTTNNVPKSKGQQPDEPITPTCSTVVPVKREQQPQTTLKDNNKQRPDEPTTSASSIIVIAKHEQQPESQMAPEDSNKEFRGPRKFRRRRGGRRNRNRKKIPAQELIVAPTDANSTSSETSIIHSDPLGVQTTTRVRSNVKEAPKQQQPRADLGRKLKKEKKPLEPIPRWMKREGRLVNVRSNPQGPYYAGPSWGRPPHPSTLPIPSFYKPQRGKLNDPIHTLAPRTHLQLEPGNQVCRTEPGK